MTLLSTCYGPDIEALADVDGGIASVSTEALVEFTLRQWTDVADTLGFSAPLRVTLNALRGSKAGLLQAHGGALATFDIWQRGRPRVLSSRLSSAARASRARVRQQVLQEASKSASNLWALDANAATLPESACFERSGANVSGRAFADDSGANYFRAQRASGPSAACGWEGPVLLSLGTFPWVYGAQLVRSPPGLDWDVSEAWSPAGAGMRVSASLWTPEGNLRQDARSVVFAYRYYLQAAESVLRNIPPHDARTAVPGQLYRRGLLLHAEQSSLELFTLTGPLGPLAANAHNYIIRRFAAFFALRRSLLGGRIRVSSEYAKMLASNPDPCVRPFAPKDLEMSP